MERYPENLVSLWRMWRDTKKVFDKCNFKTCLGVIGARFYHCNVAGHMNTAGLLSDEQSDYIDLKDKKMEQGCFANRFA